MKLGDKVLIRKELAKYYHPENAVEITGGTEWTVHGISSGVKYPLQLYRIDWRTGCRVYVSAKYEDLERPKTPCPMEET